MNDLVIASLANVLVPLAGAVALGLIGIWVRRRLARSAWRLAVDAAVLTAFVLAL